MSDDARLREQGDDVLEDRPRTDQTEAAPETEAPSGGGTEEPDGQPPEETVAALEDRLRRALADLDNLRKRYEREVVRERVTERMSVARQWLPVVDDLERALEHMEMTEDDAQAVVEGIRVVRDRALAVLAHLGFPRFDATGEPFDPARHEAVAVIDSDASPGTVVNAVQPGYGGGDAVLRPAGVVVSRARPSDNEDGEGADGRSGA
jgi:molecular chaperone GrpE